MTDGLEAGVASLLRPVLGPVAVEGLRRIAGGASRETWECTAGGAALVVRRDPPGRPGEPGGMRREADAMRACARAGLRVPEVLGDDDGTLLGTAGLVMRRVPGEVNPRRILRDEALAGARRRLVADLGAFLAGFHRLDPAVVPGAGAPDPLTVWERYRRLDRPVAVFEKAYAWLLANRPPPGARTLVHGDLRVGNVIVGPDGLAAVIDWELVRIGDPLEDLAWLCLKAWRFGEAPEVGGLGSIDELVTAYEAAGGRPVDRHALHWWLVLKTLVWGVGCMVQADVHLSGRVRSVELAVVGRRAAEQEWDLVELLAPDAWHAARTAPPPEPRPDTAGTHGRPTARELVDAVREFLVDQVAPGTDGTLAYHARVAATTLEVVLRELALPPLDRPEPDASAPWAELALAVRGRLAVASPRHLAGPRGRSGPDA